MNEVLRELSAFQNPDGGWPYRRGGSWTEPTVFALLALASAGEVSSPGVANALNWLKGRQRPDGGLAPRGLVMESTWVTALVLLLPESMLAQLNAAEALNWLLAKTGRESSWMQRLRLAMLNGQMDTASPEGWPWFPDTAAWVGPTAVALLALRKWRTRDRRNEIGDRIQQGQEFLMSRRCQDEGWNHGSTKALGYESPSYPETTGLALLALQDLPESRVARCLERAEQHLQVSRSREAVSWLQLGLLAHHRPVVAKAAYTRRSLSMQELALSAIVQRAEATGHSIFDC